MKNLLTILFLILISACASTEVKSDLVFDQKFKQCTDEKYAHLASQSFPIDTLLFQKANIHNLLENKLITSGYLKDVNRKSYLNLMNKEIKQDFFDEFNKEIGFDPDLLFPIHSFISCYGILYERMKLFDNGSWQFKFGLAYNKFEAHGNLAFNNSYLQEALMEIPERKFQNIVYRRVFLDLIFRSYH